MICGSATRRVALPQIEKSIDDIGLL